MQSQSFDKISVIEKAYEKSYKVFKIKLVFCLCSLGFLSLEALAKLIPISDNLHFKLLENGKKNVR
ncbi:transmembrane protein, putative [Medicago truncatula]|uniref:Transmembrane protein, putative n=1 Tax=Medicago truncatula TaxID=3880 RepID=A0A072UXL9_MEDTR|nr:transmembrane protein, putative [Medicago truncatula]